MVKLTLTKEYRDNRVFYDNPEIFVSSEMLEQGAQTFLESMKNSYGIAWGSKDLEAWRIVKNIYLAMREEHDKTN